MSRFQLAALGRPHDEVRHGRIRTAAALVAAAAGAVAVMLGGFVIVGSVSPADGAWAFAALGVLVLVWLSGLWWRWDAPDRRDPHHERERRGF